VGSLFAGSLIMKAFGISYGAMRVAGGMIIALLGHGMLYGKAEVSEVAKAQYSNPAFFPLALPGITGPGSIAVVIGEGGSGGALAIAVGDAVNMLQYATYSVISPEGCASILWKTAEKAADAAAALGITADRLQKLNLVDKVIEEPLGGAHRNHGELMQRLREVLAEQLRIAQDMPLSDLLDRRFDRIMAYGQFVEK